MKPVITRFAPSPTGFLHAGNYRTAVFAYLFAKKNNGAFLLRIEDTDQERSKAVYEKNIIDSLTWLNLSWDALYRQSERTELYTRSIQKLLEQDKAYVSKEIPKESGDREEVIRFRNPREKVTFTDVIRGEISVNTADLGDFIIARSITEPLYHLAVVVDDHEMNVTHIIRGEDHISNTPRQILIQRALGFATPVYAHLPLILGSDRTKLSKRRGAKALTEYRDLGYVPEAVLNYLAFLGWNPGDEREYLSRDELIELFDLSRVQKGSAVFDETKLLSINQHWMRGLSDADFLLHLESEPVSSESERRIPHIIQLLKERSKTFVEAREMLSGELLCLFERPVINREKLLAKELEYPKMTKTALEGVLEVIKGLSEDDTAETAKRAIMPLADAEEARGKGGRGAVLWPLRYALSGQERSPDPFTLIAILGTGETISRIRKAIAILSE